MPKRPQYPCRQIGCAVVVDKPGYCEQHAHKATGWLRDRMRGTRQQRGYGPDWDRLRVKILDRDGHLCQCDECQAEDRVLLATEVDHRVSKEDGGTNDPANLRAINKDCHKRKTQTEAQAGRRRAAR